MPSSRSIAGDFLSPIDEVRRSIEDDERSTKPARHGSQPCLPPRCCRKVATFIELHGRPAAPMVGWDASSAAWAGPGDSNAALPAPEELSSQAEIDAFMEAVRDTAPPAIKVEPTDGRNASIAATGWRGALMFGHRYYRAVFGLPLLRHHEFVHYVTKRSPRCTECQHLKGYAMRFVPMPERERARAELEIQIENLRALVGRMVANNCDLETTGAHISAEMNTLDRREHADREAIVPGAERAVFGETLLGAAAAMQEAIASVDLMRLHAGVAPCRSDLQDLADRLARADAAFRIVASAALRSLARAAA